MKARDTKVMLNRGAVIHVRNIGPKPVRKGGASRSVPNSSEEEPGNTRAAPIVLATTNNQTT